MVRYALNFYSSEALKSMARARGISRNCVNFFDFADGCRERSGGLVGGQFGYRWQANQWVFGLEAQGIGRISATSALAFSILGSRPRPKPVASACSLARSGMLGTRHCSTSRAARR